MSTRVIYYSQPFTASTKALDEASTFITSPLQGLATTFIQKLASEDVQHAHLNPLRNKLSELVLGCLEEPVTEKNLVVFRKMLMYFLKASPPILTFASNMPHAYGAFLRHPEPRLNRLILMNRVWHDSHAAAIQEVIEFPENIQVASFAFLAKFTHELAHYIVFNVRADIFLYDIAYACLQILKDLPGTQTTPPRFDAPHRPDEVRHPTDTQGAGHSGRWLEAQLFGAVLFPQFAPGGEYCEFT